MDIRQDVNLKTDEELVILILENQGYFTYLIERYERKLLAYVLRISNVSHQEAEDILQDVFIKVYQNLNDFDPDLKFSSWIYRITHNEVISNYRKRRSRDKDLVIDIDDADLENFASDLDITQELDDKLLRQNIFKVLDKLDIKYREVLVLKFLEEKNYREISDIIKKPMGTVATLINRAKKAFLTELHKQSINFK
ncbi:MAG: RNA polymerase sigma factor [Candidatus Magasanikbacteria bacterium]|nr:RNA polymerase sigma factor [Candidatus Magasanikbacteria bacterium]